MLVAVLVAVAADNKFRTQDPHNPAARVDKCYNGKWDRYISFPFAEVAVEAAVAHTVWHTEAMT